MKVTLWSRWDKKRGVFLFNHLGEFSEADEPEPRSDIQKKSWTGQKWSKREGLFTDGKVSYEGERLKYSSDEQGEKDEKGPVESK